MAKVKAKTSTEPVRKSRPAITPAAKESQMISLAMDLVEQRLRDGTASSQETTHFLKLGTEKARAEVELIKAQAAMAVAKKDALESQKRMDELYAEAIEAMRRYGGQGESDEY